MNKHNGIKCNVTTPVTSRTNAPRLSLVCDVAASPCSPPMARLVTCCEAAECWLLVTGWCPREVRCGWRGRGGTSV